MTPWQRQKARRNASLNASKLGVCAVLPRLPSAWNSLILKVATVVLCLAGLCGVALWMTRQMTPYSEVLTSYWNLHVRRRLWAQDLQVMADVVGIPISLHNEQESKLGFSLSWEVSWPGRLGLQGDERVYSEGSTSPMSCLTQRRGTVHEWFRLWLLLFCLINNVIKVWLSLESTTTTTSLICG